MVAAVILPLPDGQHPARAPLACLKDRDADRYTALIQKLGLRK